MSVIDLPLEPVAQARMLLHRLLDAGDVIGRDVAGRTVIQVAADDWLFEQLMVFDGATEDLEDGGDAEPECQILSFDRAPARQIHRGRL